MRVPPMPTYNQHVVTQERRNVMIIYMTLVISKGGTGPGPLTKFLGQTEARGAEKTDFRSRSPLLPLSLDQNHNEELKFAT